jgi:UDPglucose 6-dehydrogenase
MSLIPSSLTSQVWHETTSCASIASILLTVAQVAVVGTGYVGLTTGACLASLGHFVCCADVDDLKVERLRNGEIPIVEEGLSKLVRDGLESERLSFVLGARNAVTKAEFIFLCVPTPEGADGQADLSFVEAAALEIRELLPRDAVVVNKSTVPVGSTRVVERVLRRPDVSVVSNPEFLREGTAVHDFLNPDRVVVGADKLEAAERVGKLYESLGAPILVTDAASAETIKYAANAFLATKISFVNAIAAICEGVGADVRDVMRGIGYDRRIGSEFLRPGPGWGGSCFPKDTLALLKIAERADYRFDLLQGVVDVNLQQFDRMASRISKAAGPKGTIAIWGLTFKALTDDLRDSPSLEIIDRLLARGHSIRAYDPTVSAPLGKYPFVTICDSELDACRDSDALAILTEWENFRWVDPADVFSLVSSHQVIDTRNLLDRSAWRNAGFTYQGVGR